MRWFKSGYIDYLVSLNGAAKNCPVVVFCYLDGASVGAGQARDIAYARGLLCVSANRVLLGWLQSRAWPARTNMASSYKYGPLVQMARLYGAWIEFLTFKRCVYGYS